MARASFYDIFLRLPPSAAFLFLAAILGTTDGHALPRQTKTVELHELNVVAWPLIPTEAPIAPIELLRRQENTVCGYIGGNLDFPATCGAGSHCVLDTDNQVVGCCPNGGACSTGVFTGCVDGNSSPQTELNPYVYTCQGSDVCYQNTYAGGYSQYGCGTASDLATSVQTSVDGVTSGLDLPTTTVGLTQPPSSLSEPTTIGSGTRSSTAESSSSADSATTRSTGASSSTTAVTSASASPTNSATSSSSAGLPTEAPPTGGDGGSGNNNRTGAIVGGTLGAVAGLFVLAGLAFFLLRRRQNNPREGPGPAPPAPPTTEYSSPMRSHGAAFAPLPSWQDEQSNPYSSNPFDQRQSADLSDLRGDENGNYNSLPLVPPPLRYDPVHVAGVGTGLAPVAEEETHHQHHQHHNHEPAAREIDDFSRAYSDARIGRVSDDDTRPLTSPEDLTNPESTYSDASRSPIRGGNRPLWQQNRQQSRNLMWM